MRLHFTWQTIHSPFFFTVEPPLTTTSLQQPLFLADSPYTDSCLNLSTTATFLADSHKLTLVKTSLQRPLSSVSKVAVVERFNCIL